MAQIETARLVLRQFMPGDLEDLHAIFSDPDVTRYLPSGRPLPKDKTEAALGRYMHQWAQHGFGLWAAVHKQDRRLIGFGGLMHLDGTPEVEVAYTLAKAFWGQGLATEIAQASIHYGFQVLGLDHIAGITAPANLASQRVLAKAGLKYERDARFYNLDVRYHAIRYQDWRPDDSAFLTG